MLELRTVGSRPWVTANVTTVREMIPAISRLPASQQTRATAVASALRRVCVAIALTVPSVRPTVARTPISTRSLPVVGSEWTYWVATQKTTRSGTTK